MKLYLDCCCYNRPHDLKMQDRVAIEAEAVLRILSRIEMGYWDLVVSDAVFFELRRIPDHAQRSQCLAWTEKAKVHVLSSSRRTQDTSSLVSRGFGLMDAAHLAFAAAASVDFFLTVDDRL